MNSKTEKFVWMDAAFIAAPVVAVLLYLSPETTYFTNDVAMSLIISEGIFRGEVPLAGPPSQLFFRHLGPVYYFHNALLLALTQSYYAFTVLDSVLKGLLIGAVAVFFFKGLKPRLAVFVTALAGNLSWAVVVSWHSSLQIFYSTLLLFALSYIKTSVKAGTGLTILCASLLAQEHLASLPAAASAGLIALYFAFKNRACPSPWLLIFVLITWMPTLIYFISFPGDLPVAGASSNNNPASLFTTLKQVGQLLVNGTTGNLFISDDYPLFCLVMICPWVLVSVQSVLQKDRFQTISLFFLSSLGLYLVLFAAFGVEPRTYYLFSFLPVLALLSGLLSTKLSMLGGWLVVFAPLSSFLLFSPLPQLKKVETLAHVQSFTETVSGEPRCVHVSGEGISAFRQNAYYLLLGRDWYQFADQVHYFRELPLHRELPLCLEKKPGEILIDSRLSQPQH